MTMSWNASWTSGLLMNEFQMSPGFGRSGIGAGPLRICAKPSQLTWRAGHANRLSAGLRFGGQVGEQLHQELVLQCQDALGKPFDRLPGPHRQARLAQRRS